MPQQQQRPEEPENLVREGGSPLEGMLRGSTELLWAMAAKPPSPGDASSPLPGDASSSSPGNAFTTPPRDASKTPPGDAFTTLPGDASKTPPRDACMSPPGDACKSVPWDAFTTPRRDAYTTPPGMPWKSLFRCQECYGRKQPFRCQDYPGWRNQTGSLMAPLTAFPLSAGKLLALPPAAEVWQEYAT
ncbi:UNVERIFIED_CONTAM: hypothetical protein FKN15_052164 [Acipenser sinensis]